MIGFRVKVDLAPLERYANDVRRDRIPRAAGAALMRTGRAVRKEADQQIRRRWNLSSRVVKRDAIIIQRGNNRLTVAVIASGSPIALKDYQARQTKKGATFKVKVSASRRLYKRQGQIGFIVNRLGGHVFVRVEPDPPGPKKGRIKKVFGPSITQYFVSRFIRTRMDVVADEVWPKRINQELHYQFNIRA